ncbi:hypothetical protein [Streptomyces sp. BBFR2]|uniref:hypothetical protein n=1 Tax=Streptomyces sp. BBFR2 TaxID=3372854 RepID=UPI0037D9EF67
MRSAEHTVPATAAFEDAGTRSAWVAERRRVRIRLACWTLGWVVFFLALTLLDEFGILPLSDVKWSGRRGRGAGNLIGALGAVALLVCLYFVYRCMGSLRLLKRMRRTLEASPWRPVPAVRRIPRNKDIGVPVRLRLGDADEWTRDMSTYATRPRRQWPEALERGAWYAGDPRGEGVLALPGGGRPMVIKPR